MQVLRTFFFLLVLGNLLLFAWGRGYLGQAVSSEAERLSAQIAPDNLRVAGIGAPPKAVEPPREECRALSGLEQEAADRLVELITGRDAQLRLARRTLDEPKSWWGLIPPLPHSAQADRKAAELTRLGVKDFYVVRESGPNQHAVSLGLFRNEEGARDYLDALQKKNVKSARIQAREASEGKLAVEVRGSADRLARALADLPAEFTALPKAECAPARP